MPDRAERLAAALGLGFALKSQYMQETDRGFTCRGFAWLRYKREGLVGDVSKQKVGASDE